LTKQITIKLNHEHFRPVLDNLRAFMGSGTSESDSDMAGKSLFFCHQFLLQKQPQRGNRTYLEILLESIGADRAEAVLLFLNKYAEFKKKGLNSRRKR
jgi:hypothetical protein